jgi:CubicO group peptidase (beta-lactamase class C family)
MPSSRLIAFLVAAGTILPAAAPAFGESPAGDTAACDGAAPSSLGDGWTVASPAGAGLDDQRLCALGAWLAASPQTNVHAALVIRHGALVFERYFSGEDQRFGRSLGRIAFTAETKHDLRSVTKSVVALLVGIALERGQIKSVDDAVLDYLPRYADLRSPEKDRIRLRHLLTMSAGLAWDEDRPYSDPANSENEMDEAADPYRYVLAQPMAMPPGERWVYNSGATALLAAVLQEVSGQKLDALARAELFDPLGISDVEWVTYPGNGDPIGEGGLRLRPRDLAKARPARPRRRRLEWTADRAGRLDQGSARGADRGARPVLLRLSMVAWTVAGGAEGTGLGRRRRLRRACRRPISSSSSPPGFTTARNRAPFRSTF